MNSSNSIKSNNKNDILLKIAGSILLFLLLINFVLYLQYLNKILQCPYPAEYGEGVVYNLSHRMANNKKIYDPTDKMPYIHTPYTPLYFILNSTLMKLTFTSPQVCRILSICCAFGIAVLVFIMILMKTGYFPAALFLSAFLFTSPYFFEWSPLIRVDIPGIFFALCGILLACPIVKNKYSIYLSIPFFLAALMTKQILFAAPASVIIYLFIVDRKTALKFTGIFIAGIAILYLLLQYFTSGIFYVHSIKFNVIPYDLGTAFMAIGLTITAYYGITSLSVFSFLSAFAEKELSPVNIYLLTSLIACFSIGKAGGASNHLVEFIIASTINAGYSFDYFLKWTKASGKSRSFGLLIPVFLLIAQVITLYFVDTSIANKMSGESLGSKKKPVPWSPYNQSEVPEYNRLDVEQYEEISRYIKAVAGPVLCENVGLLTVNGKEVLYQPFQFKHLAKMGIFDERKILDMIEKGKFDLIIMTRESVKDGASWLYSDKIIDAIWSNYAPIKSIGEYDIYTYIGNLL